MDLNHRPTTYKDAALTAELLSFVCGGQLFYVQKDNPMNDNLMPRRGPKMVAGAVVATVAFRHVVMSHTRALSLIHPQIFNRK